MKCVYFWQHSHAHVSVRVVELHLRARLDPAHRPRLVPGHRWHDHASRGSEVRRPVAQHNGRILLHGRGGPVDGGRHLVHHDVLAPDPWLAGHALETAHGPADQEREHDQRR